jgi:protein-tyrosine phosphatase
MDRTPPALADLHTHVLHAVDDGARDLESALSALEVLFEDGVRAVAATPHLTASDPNGNLRARADRAWPELVEGVRQRLPGLRLYRGYEISLDTPDPDLSDPGLRLGGSRFALVEFYNFTVPDQSAAALARIVASGYVPIIAHPERYWGYDRELAVVAEWRKAGALIQLNSGGLLGEYGDAVKALAHRLLAEGKVDLIASDNHARPTRNPSLRAVWDYLVDRGLEEKARLLTSTNPSRILEDHMPIMVGRLETKDGFFSKLARAFRGSR